MTSVLSLQAIGKIFEPGAPVLQDVSLRIEPGAMVCLLGPSGCGKTTLLRLIAGFEEPDNRCHSLGGATGQSPRPRGGAGKNATLAWCFRSTPSSHI